MNSELKCLLKITPGSIYQQQDNVVMGIDFNEWTQTLTMMTSKLPVEVGKLVRVRRSKCIFDSTSFD